MEDSKIIDLYWARDEQAIAQTQQKYGSKLYALSYRILSSREDSEECVSDTYMKAWDTIPPQRPNFFLAYLSKICRFLSLGRLDWNTAAKRTADMEELSSELALCLPGRSPEAKLEAEETGRLITRFLDAQPRESRLIFMRRYWYADSVAEIADRYGITESKVKTRLHRTREKLKEFLEKEEIFL